MEIRPIVSALLRNKTGALLIAAQIALTLAIVSNAAYIIRDRVAISSRPSGIDDESRVFHIAVDSINTPGDPLALQKQEERLLAALPGVESVSATNQTPLSQSGWNMGLFLDKAQTDSSANIAFYFTPGPLVRTLGLKLVEGRDLTDADVEVINVRENEHRLGHVAVISQALAKKLFPGDASAVGKHVFLGNSADAPEYEIVGVVERLQSPWAQHGEAGELSLITAIRPIQAYVDYVVRTEPGQIDRVMREVEAALTRAGNERLLIDKQTMPETRNQRYRADNAMVWMLLTITVLLLLVTASGIVGMATLWVNQRRKQIGVRRALGARRADILRYFITENVLISSLGIAAGTVLALALNQLLVSQFELSRLPLPHLLVGMGVLWILGIVAVYGPARRAASVAPATATRSA
ncbi:MAG: ABC transporter permease [Gammaproteobacteria bacterium HGW-Gammaproteobacteria-5]|jgi:putative ABC transport system permease protein|nr:MAG: ABC transporter permease [Gammaproteobacteria bacterium HGW-Gammaproteobacteria-5]